jgi:uncharacterized protein (DUF1800 family)
MKWKRTAMCFSAGTIIFLLSAFAQIKHADNASLQFPYKKAGLTERQAAAHLLSRFTFGATPNQIDEVVNMGLEKWFQQQLNGNLSDDEVNKRLQSYDALTMSNETIVNTFLKPGDLLKVAAKNNIIPKDTLAAIVANPDKQQYRAQIKQFMDANGYKPLQELNRQLINQKIIRAAYGNNQLQEVMTDFWFNHFNVSLTKNQCAQYILTYERDAIRPNVLGNFEKLLEATAKHPAMLEYLDNASSVSNDNYLARRQQNSVAGRIAQRKMDDMMNDDKTAPAVKQALQARKNQGLNENYAREIMELHTLGVDGGYTQNDVTEVARALTGWSVMPLNKDNAYKKFLEPAAWDRMEKNGFVREGDFLYRADKHDENAKNILGKSFPSDGGYAEGLKVLEMLANHPSTAKFISKKLAVRFVSDTPSDELINYLAQVFLQSKGNIKNVMMALVNSDEFWKPDALREKVKSPFEFAISAIRATNADLQQPFQIFNWCTKMGQKFYYYQAPTGFPDKASYWINTGSLLNRMNFGLAFATEKIPGLKINLAALNNNHEPESADAALVTYSNLLLPERNNDQNIKRLTQLIHDNNVQQKINDAAAKNQSADANVLAEDNMMVNDNAKAIQRTENAALNKNNKPININYSMGNNSMVGQVAGVIIGSPEFQRR